ncbi:DUF4179 domain-containing protein [Cohnella abietis]|uniref:DUF4179 domain-containing protein n=1 Tax=Cohnella abietis TaxID=2507935 RepID=A0A3T1D5E7_9BACL|nr:DUF4179 domain-containing protein [Cohnella abietis]BBI33330.1 hypothetical protein KCTCHS21_27290 [Cohnella abietis]
MNLKELTSFYNEITPTDEQKQNMYAKIKTYQEGEAPMKKTTKKVTALAVVVAVFLLFTTAVFASTLNWNELLIQHFKPSKSQIKAMKGNVSIPEATVTNNGVTITVKQTIVDSQNVYVLYEMTVPESIDLNDDIRWKGEYFGLKPKAMGEARPSLGGGSTILKQDKHTRTGLYYKPLTVLNGNSAAIMLFEDLTLNQMIYDKKGEFMGLNRIPLIEGEWEITWDLMIDDTQSIKLEPNKPLSLKKSKNKVTKIEISPLSIYILIEGSDILTRVKPIVKFKDGSQLSFNFMSTGKSFSYNYAEGSVEAQGNHLYYKFDQIISPEDVESISIGDVTIPVLK